MELQTSILAQDSPDLMPSLGIVAAIAAGVLALFVVVLAFIRGDFMIVMKQMRQRALATWLTLLSVLLGTTLAIGILLARRGGESLFAQTDYGYDVLVGSANGSPLQLVLNSVYHLDKSPGTIPYAVYEQLAVRTKPRPGQFNYFQHVKLAVPFALGDTYRGRPIVGTLPLMFGIDLDGNAIPPVSPLFPDQMNDAIFQYRPEMRYELAEGRIYYERRLTEKEIAALTKEAEAAAATQPAGGDLMATTKPVVTVPRWEAKFEAVIGSEVAKSLNMCLYDERDLPKNKGKSSTFKATHGASEEEPAGEEPGQHAEEWKIVGILKPTNTPADRTLFVPLTTFYAIGEHEAGLEAASAARQGKPTGGPADVAPGLPYTLFPDGRMRLRTPMHKWVLSGIFIKSRGGLTGRWLRDHINAGGVYSGSLEKTNIVSVNPAEVMSGFFNTFLQPIAQLLLLITALVSIVAAVGILVSIYNSVSARNREIAILRALGATRGRVLRLICLEAGLIGFVGAILGWVGGHLIGWIASQNLEQRFGRGFDWWAVTASEWWYLGGVVAIAVLAGFVPAVKAYRTPVATNLVAGS